MMYIGASIFKYKEDIDVMICVIIHTLGANFTKIYVVISA